MILHFSPLGYRLRSQFPRRWRTRTQLDMQTKTIYRDRVDVDRTLVKKKKRSRSVTVHRCGSAPVQPSTNVALNYLLRVGDATCGELLRRHEENFNSF